MAGDWIKMRVLLASDPKVVTMADYLAGQRQFMDWLTNPIMQSCKESAYEHVTRNVTVSVTVCALLRVWGIVSERGKPDGDDVLLHHGSLDTLDEVAGIPCFGDAMRYVNWVLCECDDDAEILRFPRFLVENTIAEDRLRKQNSERQKRFRERNVTRNGVRNVTSNAKRNAREEKRRALDANASNNPHTPQGVLPFDTDSFRLAWADWEQHHRERRKPITPTARKQQLAKLERMGHDRAVACLQHSTAQGWQGLYEPDGNRGSSGPAQTRLARVEAPPGKYDAIDKGGDGIYRRGRRVAGEEPGGGPPVVGGPGISTPLGLPGTAGGNHARGSDAGDPSGCEDVF